MTRVAAFAGRRAAVAVVAALLLALAALLPSAARAQQQVTVTDPYIELRTGAGRGFPVFYVAQRGESVEIVLRKTDWYKVRTANGQEGWVTRDQLATTLTAAGTATTFRDLVVDDYLRRRLEMGAAWGQFDGAPMLKLWAGYKFADALSIEATLGQVQGVFSGTDFWNVNVNVEPWSDRRLSPFFGVGVGRFQNFPNASLVGAIDTAANMAEATAGLRYYIAERFVARLDYTIYTAYVSEAGSQQYRAWTLGVAFFF